MPHISPQYSQLHIKYLFFSSWTRVPTCFLVIMSWETIQNFRTPSPAAWLELQDLGQSMWIHIKQQQTISTSPLNTFHPSSPGYLLHWRTASAADQPCFYFIAPMECRASDGQVYLKFKHIIIRAPFVMRGCSFWQDVLQLMNHLHVKPAYQLLH